MKRVFHHPPEPTTGKHYWRGLGEYSNSPEFRQWLEREFPAGAAELNGNEWSRRDFLKLMGASMALAGVGLTSCRRPELHLVPFTKNVEWTIPGKFLYYATAMPRRNGAIPLIATTVDGRPIKLEGNPLHPASRGATDTFTQASILDLYDPTRSKRFVRNGKTSKREDFEAYIKELRNKFLTDHGDGLAFLVEETNSPTRERLRGELEKNLPGVMSHSGVREQRWRRRLLSELGRARFPSSIAPISCSHWTVIFSIAGRAISRQCARSLLVAASARPKTA